MAQTKLPWEIENIVRGKNHTVNTTGMSGAQVWMYEDMVLKIQPCMPWVRRELTMLQWLSGRLPVPRLIAHQELKRKSYCLMTRIRGKMACDSQFLDNPELLTARLAEAMQMLWSVDTSACPVCRSQELELEEARRQVEEGRVDITAVEPETFGPGGFPDPETLLVWLEKNRPSYDPVLSHGDFCLPNIFLTQTGISGFIDLGDAGVGDRWRDISLCWRSLKNNTNGRHGKIRPEVDPARLFDALGIRPDREKMRWYLLLDELF